MEGSETLPYEKSKAFMRKVLSPERTQGRE